MFSCTIFFYIRNTKSNFAKNEDAFKKYRTLNETKSIKGKVHFVQSRFLKLNL